MGSGIFEKGVELGNAYVQEETILALFDFGMTKEEISKTLKIDLDVIQVILS